MAIVGFKRTSIFICAAFLVSGSAPCQVAREAFALRGDAIGESIADFRARNHRVDPEEPVILGVEPQGFPKCSGDLDLSKLPQAPKTPGPDWASKFEAYRKAAMYSLQERNLDEQAESYGGRVCEVGDYFGGTVADVHTLITYAFKQDKLDSISANFDRSDFAQVKTAIVTKYGEPDRVEKREWKNAAGAEFTGEVAIWARPSSAIQLSEFSGDINRSSLRIFNPQTQIDRRQSEQIKANSDF